MNGLKIVQCCNSNCTNALYVPRETPSECRQCETCIEKRKDSYFAAAQAFGNVDMYVGDNGKISS